VSKYEPSEEARRALALWRDVREMPAGDEVRHLKQLDLLNTKDGRPWDGECGIFALVDHALQQWTRQMIQVPGKLREQSKKYPGLMQWQVMIVQIVSGKKGGDIKSSVQQSSDDWMPSRAPEADDNCGCAETDGAPGFTRVDGKMKPCPMCELGQYYSQELRI